ncbi:S9 family peptidase [Humibacillus xanthopallidus]|uniref:Oligopeptidase B n=1 Tax=Humibacillus xanthopallidus TaxID=412689 RepID=A0A543HJ96_9MICO|nr:S9 family peptidase [Humibacillus xanthopallidus]TQM58421.1 oligopeptidase B [Humibacillus xanthopallidus]
MQPPIARRSPVARVHHGDRFEDPYTWMADRESPELLELLAAENAYATEQTERLKPLAEEIFEEFRSRIEETDLSVPVRHDRWWYYSRTIEGEQYAVEGRVALADHPARPALSDGRPPAGEEVLLDQNAAAAGHDFFGVGASEVSPAGDLLAYAVDLAGDERYDVRVRSIATGETLDEAVRSTGGSLAWSLDGRHLFYTRVDDAWRPYQVWRHELGTAVEADALVHEESDERFFVGVGSSRDDHHVIIAISSKTTSEFRLLDAADPLGTPRVVAERRAGVEYDIEPMGDQLLVTHNANRTNFELAIAPVTCTSAQEWVALDLTAEDEFVTGAEGFDDFIAISLRREGGTGVRIVLRDPAAPHGLGAAHDISVGEPIGTIHVGVNPESSTPTLQVVHESLVTPRTVEDYDVRARTFTLLKAQRVRDGHDLAQYRQRREWATAPDGTRVPISIVHRADVVADGTAPALLHGYGAYGIPSDPWFSVLRLSLLQRGWVFAIAHVRGGSEMGRSWYDDGKLTAKPHTFSDFVACADHLRDTGIVAPDRLAAEGGSAGGLLMGVVANQAPDRFRFIHASVPFVDALTTILDPSMPLTVVEWEEWGNPLEDPAAYALMKSYTPYENVCAQRYPALLVTTSLHDTRVYVTEPAKWVAALRHETRDVEGAAPILFRTEMAGGHGGQSGRYDTWRQWAWETSVLLGAVT